MNDVSLLISNCNILMKYSRAGDEKPIGALG